LPSIGGDDRRAARDHDPPGIARIAAQGVDQARQGRGGGHGRDPLRSVDHDPRRRQEREAFGRRWRDSRADGAAGRVGAAGDVGKRPGKDLLADETAPDRDDEGIDRLSGGGLQRRDGGIIDARDGTEPHRPACHVVENGTAAGNDLARDRCLMRQHDPAPQRRRPRDRVIEPGERLWRRRDRDQRSLRRFTDDDVTDRFGIEARQSRREFLRHRQPGGIEDRHAEPGGEGIDIVGGGICQPARSPVPDRRDGDKATEMAPAGQHRVMEPRRRHMRDGAGPTGFFGFLRPHDSSPGPRSRLNCGRTRIDNPRAILEHLAKFAILFPAMRVDPIRLLIRRLALAAALTLAFAPMAVAQTTQPLGTAAQPTETSSEPVATPPGASSEPAATPAEAEAPKAPLKPFVATGPVHVPNFWDPNNRPEKPNTPIAAIRFLTSDGFPPFNFVSADGRLTGFNVELARAICEALEAECTIQMRPFENWSRPWRKSAAMPSSPAWRSPPRTATNLLSRGPICGFPPASWSVPARIWRRHRPVSPTSGSPPSATPPTRLSCMPSSATRGSSPIRARTSRARR